MRIFDEETYLRMPTKSRHSYIGFITDVNNNYILFEGGEDAAYAQALKEVEEKGRKSVDFSKYGKVEEVPSERPEDPRLDGLSPENQHKNKEVLEILKELSQPKGKLTLNKAKTLFLEIFKNY